MVDLLLCVSFWFCDVELNSFCLFVGIMQVDVLVVGVGMIGLLIVVCLVDSGLDVLVVDVGFIGGCNMVMFMGNFYVLVFWLVDLIVCWGGDMVCCIVQWWQQVLWFIEILVYCYDLCCGFECVVMQYGMQECICEVIV